MRLLVPLIVAAALALAAFAGPGEIKGYQRPVLEWLTERATHVEVLDDGSVTGSAAILIRIPIVTPCGKKHGKLPPRLPGPDVIGPPSPPGPEWNPGSIGPPPPPTRPSVHYLPPI